MPRRTQFFRSRASRGQALTEFMILLSMMVLYMAAFSLIYGGQQQNQIYFLKGLLGRETTDSVALRANAAYIAGNGSSVNLTVANASSNISVVNHIVQLVLEDGVVGSPLVTSQVYGNFTAGQKTARNFYGNISIG